MKQARAPKHERRVGRKRPKAVIPHPAPGFSWWPGHRGRRAAEDAALFCPTGRPRRGPCSLALTRRWNPPLPDPRRTHRLPQDPV